MPHIVVHQSGEPDTRLTNATVEQICRLTQDVLGKSLAVISIEVVYVPDETNTKAEKARYLKEVFAAMASLRADLHEVSYVHLVDARAAAYGYGGATQEFRFQRAAA